MAGVLLVALAVGCGPDEIKVYTVPKESAPPALAAESPASQPDLVTPVGGVQLRWTTPAGWEEVPPGTIRVASFKIAGPDGKQADVSVVPLPGDAGGDFSNVNRWRGQVGLAPISEVELAKLTEPVEVAGQPAALYEQPGDSVRILAAIQHRDGTTWFFKMTGDSPLVAQAKPAFVEFLKSLRFEAGAPRPAPVTPGGLPVGHPDVSEPRPAAAPAVLTRAGQPNWTVPAGWQEVGGGQFLVAKFMITGAGNAQAAVNVSSSAGDGGGALSNVNRWRGQLGLAPIDPQVFADGNDNPAPGGPRYQVDITGTDPKTGKPVRLVGAIVPQSGQTWFYKLMGEATVVGAQKAAFIQFVQGVKY